MNLDSLLSSLLGSSIGDKERTQLPGPGLEEAWASAVRQGGSAELTAFLPSPTDPDRLPKLVDLIKQDLELRWQHQHELFIEFYLKTFPEISDPELVHALIQHEIRVRRRFGDEPLRFEYQKRFPTLTLRLDFSASAPLPQQVPLTTSNASQPTSSDGGMAVRSGANLQIGGGYRLLEQLGSGGFGEVWRAEAPGGVPAAVKIIFRPLADEATRKELVALELVKRLAHPFLVQTQAYWSLQDRLLIVMELAESNLRQRLRQCQAEGSKGVCDKELIGYMREAAEALDFLHEQNIQHRDIKPENMLILKGHLKLADFGLAQLRQADQSLVSAPLAGTAPYMAPEVWNNKLSRHSDQYSLALSYVELRTGVGVYPRGDLFATMTNHLQLKPNLELLPEAEREIVQRALSKKPAERFPTCSAFIEDLYKAAFPPPPPPVAAFRLLLAAVCVLACIAAGLGLREWLRPTGQPNGGAGATVKAEPERPPWLPEGGRKAEDATIVNDALGKSWYSRIVLEKADKRIRFCLAPQTKTDDAKDPQTFYIMEDKVSNGLFKTALADRAFEDELKNLEQINAKDNPVKRQWSDGGVKTKKTLGWDGHDDWPVLRVTVTEAACFAEWLAPRGGLPSVEQWNKAAGLADGSSPLNDLPQIPTVEDLAIGRKEFGPMDVGKARFGRSIYGCRDMVGNGLEWTRTLAFENGAEVSIRRPQLNKYVVLCGWSYAQALSGNKEHLQLQAIEAKVWPFCTPDAETGFRVVISP